MHRYCAIDSFCWGSHDLRWLTLFGFKLNFLIVPYGDKLRERLVELDQICSNLLPVSEAELLVLSQGNLFT